MAKGKMPYGAPPTTGGKKKKGKNMPKGMLGAKKAPPFAGRKSTD